MSRNYSNTAVRTTLTGSISAGATTIPVASATGFPAAPFIVALDADGVAQELVLITAVVGLSLTATRGYDNTTAVAHSAGAAVQHSHAAIDFRQSRDHEAATTGVHGVTGSFVGTSDTQTLTNKTINVDNNTVSGLAATSFALTNGSGNLDGAAAQKVIPAGAVVGTTDTQTLTNKTISADNNTLSGIAASSFVLSNGSGNIDGSAAQKAIPSGVVVGTTDTQTLTNKNLTSSTNTFPYTGPDVQVFTASGTWNKPANAKHVRIRVVAGGGGGGSADATGAGQHSKGSGGGGGGYAESTVLASSLGASVSVTVGAGGSAGIAGGDSIFGTTCTATGGAGGATATPTATATGLAGGAGGAGTVGSILATGGAGGNAFGSGALGMSGPGGDSVLGGGGTGRSANTGVSLAGIAGGNFGGGGGGALVNQSSSSNVGGSGAPGVVIVETWFA